LHLINLYYIHVYDKEITFAQIALIDLLSKLVTMLPISINGVGVREWAYIVLLGKSGVAAYQTSRLIM